MDRSNRLWAFLLPFTIGHHISRSSHKEKLADGRTQEGELRSDNIQNNQPRIPAEIQQDGFISALLLFIMLVSFAFVILFGPYITDQQTDRIQTKHGNALLSIYLISACVFMWLFSNNNLTTQYTVETTHHQDTAEDISSSDDEDDEHETSDSSDEDSKELIKALQHSIPLVGLVIFFCLGLGMDVMRLFCHWTCMDAFLACNLTDKFILSTIFHIMRVIFLGSSINFACKFHHKTFRRTVFTQYALMVILAATAAVWVNCMLFDAKEILPENSGDVIKLCTIQDPQNDPLYTNVTACLLRETTLYQWYETVSSYLYPLHIEFGLMMMEILFHLLFSATDEPETGVSQTSIVLEPVSEPTLTMPHQVGSNITDGSPEDHSLNASMVSIKVFRLQSGWVVIPTLVMTVVFVLMGALTYLDPSDRDITDLENCSYNWRSRHEVSKLIYYTWMTVACIIGFYASKSGSSNFREYSALELLVLLTSTGFFIHTFMGIVANVAVINGTQLSQNTTELVCHFESSNMTITVLASKIVNAFQVFLQITYLFHVGRIRGQTENTLYIIKHTLLTLAIGNIAMWLMDSIIEINNTQLEPSTTYYFTEYVWGAMSHVLIPIALFFRFNSFLITLEQYFEHA